jgi:hypothetical protein
MYIIMFEMLVSVVEMLVYMKYASMPEMLINLCLECMYMCI